MSDLDLRGKRVFIRSDLNVPLEDGRITDDTRIRASVPGIRLALERGAAVMVTSHLGRPTEGELKPEDSPNWGPIKAFPAAIGAADRLRLTEAYRASITHVIYPALTGMRDFLQSEYLPHARDGVGLLYMKGGDALYRYEVDSTTTTTMTPEQIHQLGLSEVARITGDFDKVKQQVAFTGDLHSFFDYMRTNPRFAPKSREQLPNDFHRLKQAAEANASQFFSAVPRTPLVNRPYPAYPETFDAWSTYYSGSPDGIRPGYIYSYA